MHFGRTGLGCCEATRRSNFHGQVVHPRHDEHTRPRLRVFCSEFHRKVRKERAQKPRRTKTIETRTLISERTHFSLFKTLASATRGHRQHEREGADTIGDGQPPRKKVVLAM